MSIKYLTILVILIFYGLTVKAQGKTLNYPSIPKKVSIHGRVTPVQEHPDTIICYYQKTYWFERYDAEKVTLVTDAEGKFRYSFPSISKPGRISIVIPGKQSALDKYIIEPGDSIEVNIDQPNLLPRFTITGRGSEKYRCQQAIDAQSRQWEAQFNVNMGEMYEWSTYQRRRAIGDSIMNLHQNILISYGASIHPLVQDMIRADYIGREKLRWQCPSPSEAHYNQHAQQYAPIFAHAALPSNDHLAAVAMAASPDYLLYLQLKTYYQLLHDKKKFFDFMAVYGAHFEEMYKHIKLMSSGVLQEKLLFNFLLNNFQDNGVAYAQCLQDAVNWVKEEETSVQLKNLLGQRGKGLPFFAFKLPDTSGGLVQLADFAGKIVVIEFWFTGCGGCAKVAAEMKKEVYPIFKSNPNIAFVSVGMDVSRQQWLESVRKEKYGLMAYTNLSTEGFDHPLLKYYQVQGGPRMMIIDGQGNMYSSTPPLFGRSPELITLLNEALATLQSTTK